MALTFAVISRIAWSHLAPVESKLKVAKWQGPHFMRCPYKGMSVILITHIFVHSYH